MTIKAVFPDRDVAVMVRPALTEADLQRLDQLPYSSLRPEFKKVRKPCVVLTSAGQIKLVVLPAGNIHL